MATVLRGQGDGIEGERILYMARKVEGPWLVRRSGRHRGMRGKLYDGEAYVDLPIEGTRP